MQSNKDSQRYCIRCKKRNSCKEPCFPVEELLKTLESDNEYLPIVFIEHFQRTGKLLEPPTSWLQKPKKEKIFELFFHDRLTVTEVSVIVGCDKAYVSRIVDKIKGLLTNGCT